jgi:hypothetical protein
MMSLRIDSRELKKLCVMKTMTFLRVRLEIEGFFPLLLLVDSNESFSFRKIFRGEVSTVPQRSPTLVSI